MPGWMPCGADCCDNICLLGTDAFGTDADPPSGWTEGSGTDWATVSGTLRTATSNAALKFNTVHPGGIASAYVSVKCYGASGDALRVLLNYTDARNYHFVEFTIGSPNGCLALWKRVAGTNTLISKRRVDAAASTLHTITATFGQGLFSARLGSGSDTLYHIATGTGTAVGLGTGTIASTVRFDDFSFYRHRTTTTGETTCPAYSPTCLLVDDTFNRANDTDLGCSWNESAGAWAIASNVAETASSNAELVSEVVQPFERANMTLNVDISNTASGDTVRLIVGRSGPNDFYCVDLLFHTTAGSRERKIRQCIGGAFTDLYTVNDGNLVPGSSKTEKLCVGGGRIMSDIYSRDVATVSGAGKYQAALATATITGTVRFDNFSLYMSGYDDSADYDLDTITDLRCEPCGTDCCCGNDAGDEWIVDISATGFTNDRWDQCTNLDGEYTVRYNPTLSSNVECIYTYEADLGTDTCTGGTAHLLIKLYLAQGGNRCDYDDAGANSRINVHIELTQTVGGCVASQEFTAFVTTGSITPLTNCHDADLNPLVLAAVSAGSQFPVSPPNLCGNFFAGFPTIAIRPA